MSMSGVRVIVHEDRLRNNIRLLHKRHTGLLPVIKANAYGHGRLTVARVLEEEGIRAMGVGTVDEGIALRRAGVRAELLVMMGLFAAQDAQVAATLDLMPLVHSFETLQWVLHCGAPLKVAIKCDTGMSRLGFTEAQIPAVLAELHHAPHVQLTLLVSHLAVADDPAQHAATLAQVVAFYRITEQVRAVFPKVRTSLGNSAGLLNWADIRAAACGMTLPERMDDMARPGLIVYGLDPSYGTRLALRDAGFLPVMEAWSPVLNVHTLAAGQSVSYGSTFTASQPMRVAVVAAGYADGYTRALSGVGAMCLRGVRVPVLGRVCMQMSIVDVTHVPDVQPGERAWLLGGEGEGAVSAHDLARWADSIPYEILCMLGTNPHIEPDGVRFAAI